MKNKTHSEMVEISGSIIDIFEDWLESKGITTKDIPNEDRDEFNKENCIEDENDTEGAIIFGFDYDEIENNIENILKDKLR